MTEMSGKETTMLSYHGDPAVKAGLVADYEAHRAADEIVQGVYWQNGKGCLIGCAVHGGDHGLFESRYGVPRIVVRLADHLFEGLPAGEAKELPVRFASAIPVGADLSCVGWRFLAWVLRDLPAASVTSPDVRAAVELVTVIMDRLAAGEAVPEDEIAAARQGAGVVWEAAHESWAAAAGEAAAEAAEWATAGAAEAASASGMRAAEAVSWATSAAAASAAWAATSGMRAAEASAEVAATAAYRAASATVGARENAYRRQADKLIALLAEAAPA